LLKGKPMWLPESSQNFLHVFHHATTGAVAWFAWRQELSIAWIGPLTNAFVHTAMYGYYAGVTVMPSVKKYGKYITPIQILQFRVCLLSLVPSFIDLLFNQSRRCGDTTRCVWYMVFTYAVYLVLFVKMSNAKKAARQAAKIEAQKEKDK
jgi:hypothetical protein